MSRYTDSAVIVEVVRCEECWKREFCPMVGDGCKLPDDEYEEAKLADEKEEYFYVTHKMSDGKVGHYIKKYKPSVAKLFAERTGDMYEQIC